MLLTVNNRPYQPHLDKTQTIVLCCMEFFKYKATVPLHHNIHFKNVNNADIIHNIWLMDVSSKYFSNIVAGFLYW